MEEEKRDAIKRLLNRLQHRPHERGVKNRQVEMLYWQCRFRNMEIGSSQLKQRLAYILTPTNSNSDLSTDTIGQNWNTVQGLLDYENLQADDDLCGMLEEAVSGLPLIERTILNPRGDEYETIEAPDFTKLSQPIIKDLEPTQEETVIEPPPPDPIQDFILGAQRTEPDIQPPPADPPDNDFVPDPTNWRPILIVVGIIVAVGLLIGAGKLAMEYVPLGLNWVADLFEREPEPSAPAVVEVTKVVERVVPGDPPTPIPVTPTPIVVVEEIEKIVTATYPPITNTPEPTSIPKPTGTLIPLPIEDNLSTGPSDIWEEIGGNPVWTPGRLGTDGGAWLAVGDSNWTDYRVEILEPRIIDWAWPEMDIGVRGQNASNLIAFRYRRGSGNNRHGQWVIYENGKDSRVPGTNIDSVGDIANIIIEVEGNSFTARLPDGQESQLFNTDYPTGKIFLHIGQDTSIGGIKVSPIDE